MKVILTLACFALALTACQKSIELSPDVERNGTLLSGFEFEYDESADTILVSAPGGSATLMREVSIERNDIRIYENGGVITALAISNSGAGSAFLVTGIPELSGTLVSRIEDTEMPTSGTASFSGDYTGFLVNPVDHTLAAFFSGQANLEANFGDMTIDGIINDRIMFGPIPETTSDDVELSKTVITGTGSFVGVATGGAVRFPGASSSPGLYSGLIVGSDGQEVVGDLLIPHFIDGGPFEEIGIFEAAE